MLRNLSLSQLKNCDSFAKSVQFTFRGHHNFSTKIGGIVTLVCLALFSVLFLVKTIHLLLKADPDFFMVESESDFKELDLYELGFMFAI